MADWITNRLEPFGLVVEADEPGTDLKSVPVTQLQTWVDENRVVVLRGFKALNGSELPEFGARLGKIQEWDFGAVNDLQVRTNAKNYLYTNRVVPFHWDGAFVGQIPHYIVFHCDIAPHLGSGGETLFADTSLLLEQAPREKVRLWEQVTITYTTEKIVHYGGSFTSDLLSHNPLNGENVMRFAEPVADLNPVNLEIMGIPEAEQAAFLDDLHGRLHDNAVCYRHEWKSGDVLIADNFVLLHGRNSFSLDSERRIRRVNVL
ncbi:MAG TPA: TauD/TfdA family dioxygenase [Pyrinomonadaceae bacterium]|nr:TauD/TfdA family dioxygenase [Pyrinomonadaceae bacterium]